MITTFNVGNYTLLEIYRCLKSDETKSHPWFLLVKKKKKLEVFVFQYDIL